MEDALTIVNNSIESINNLESINENMIRMSEMVRNGGGIENAEGGGWADDDDDDDDDFVEMEVANARGAAGHGGLWAGSSKRAAGGAAAGGRDQALSTRPSRPGAAPGERVYSELELKKLKKREYNAAYKQKLLQRSMEGNGAGSRGGGRSGKAGGARSHAGSSSRAAMAAGGRGKLGSAGGAAMLTSGSISKKSETYLDQHYFNITKVTLNTLRKVYNNTHRHTSSNNRQWIMKMLIKAEDESVGAGRGSILEKWLGEGGAAVTPSAHGASSRGANAAAERSGVKKGLFDISRSTKASPRATDGRRTSKADARDEASARMARAKDRGSPAVGSTLVGNTFPDRTFEMSAIGGGARGGRSTLPYVMSDELLVKARPPNGAVSPTVLLSTKRGNEVDDTILTKEESVGGKRSPAFVSTPLPTPTKSCAKPMFDGVDAPISLSEVQDAGDIGNGFGGLTSAADTAMRRFAPTLQPLVVEDGFLWQTDMTTVQTPQRVQTPDQQLQNPKKSVGALATATSAQGFGMRLGRDVAGGGNDDDEDEDGEGEEEEEEDEEGDDDEDDEDFTGSDGDDDDDDGDFQAAGHEWAGRVDASFCSMRAGLRSNNAERADATDDAFAAPVSSSVRKRGGTARAPAKPRPRKKARHSGRAATYASTRKGRKKKKSHHPWTVDECAALVDGVERCGGGKWADIKKLDFPQLSERSAVDLKDKWRNILKSLRVATSNGEGVENARCNIPVHLLRRVKELDDKGAATAQT